MLQRRAQLAGGSPGGADSRGGTLTRSGGDVKPPEDDMKLAAVCIFCLSDNFFRDKRSMLLIDRAVRLGKKVRLGLGLGLAKP